jgi:hypothetical protein
MTEWLDAASEEVQTWMEELNGFDIPSWTPTVDGTCLGDPTSAAQATARGWWTCSRTTRDTDITTCPKKLDWGVSFDDGPSPYSECSRYFFPLMFTYLSTFLAQSVPSSWAFYVVIDRY